MGIGTKESELIATLSDKGITVFSVAEAAEIMGISRTLASDLVLRLMKKKKLIRIEKAKYLIVPMEAWKSGRYTEEGIVIASQLLSPYYISYWSALSFYGWTEQPPGVVFVATTKQKQPIEMAGVSLRFVRLKPDRFFGYSEKWLGSRKVNVADPEKTIIDCLDQPRYCGEVVEAAKGLWNGRKEIDFDKLLKYADRMSNGAIVKRLGYLMETLEILKPGYRQAIRTRLTTGYALLDPGKGKAGTYNSEWNIRVNVKPENLVEWRRH